MSHRKRALSIALLAIMTAGCGGLTIYPAGLPDSGQVVDIETRKPLAGADVLVYWIKSGIFDQGSSCSRVEHAVTDAEGRFSTKGWIGPNPGDREKQYLIYAPGYDTYRFVRDGYYTEYRMVRFKGTDRDRLHQLMKASRSAICEEPSFAPVSVIDRMAVEAQRLAGSDTELGKLASQIHAKAKDETRRVTRYQQLTGKKEKSD